MEKGVFMDKLIRGDIELGEALQLNDEDIYPESSWLKDRLEWFQDLKLGFIIHWGLYAQAGIVESWQLSEKDDWARQPKAWREDINQLKLDYWNLIETFNPTEFDPDIWMKILSEAGFKYGIVTSKHHDGFNLFNTSFSEFKVCGKQSPCKVDLYKKILDSMRKFDLFPGVYYSKADWYHPDYWVDDQTIKGRHVSYDTDEFPEKWRRYVEFVHLQIEELTSNYGEIHFLWLDAGWCGEGNENLEMDKVAEIARKKNPKLIMVNRAMGGRHENYVTPERKIPEFDKIPTKPWESNVPIGNDWGFVPEDVIKSGDELIKIAIEIIGKGGNVLFGVGPTPKGTLLEEEVLSIQRLGSWINIYGEGIYSTRAWVEKDQDSKIFRTTKQDTVYIFVMSELCGVELSLEKLLSVKLISQIESIEKFDQGVMVQWNQRDNSIVIDQDENRYPVYGCKIKLINKEYLYE